MRTLLQLLAILLLLTGHVPEIYGKTEARASLQEVMTLKSQMLLIHETFGVNFIYDSSLKLDAPYHGKPVKDIIAAHPGKDEKSLELCLSTLFSNSGISYDILKRHVVLTKDGDSKVRDYTIFIEGQRDTLDESIITVHIDRKRNTTQTGLHSIDFRRFGKGFATLGSPDVIKEIQNLPGVSGGTELLSGMYVHGGDGKDNLFLLDGVPLYQVTHLAGLISSFNTEVINDIGFYKSGFPSRYGGKASSVVDITTRQGDMNTFRGSFNMGLLNGGLQLEGPLIPGRTSFNVALRRSWFDLLTVPGVAIYNSSLPYGEKHHLGYAMTDMNASITHLQDRHNRLNLNLYIGSDKIRIGHEAAAVKYWEGTRHTGENAYDLQSSWGNILASLNWSRIFSDELHMNSILYYTRTNTDVMLYNREWELNETKMRIMDYSIHEDNRSRLHDIGAKASFDWIPSDCHHIRAGADFTQHIFKPQRDVLAISSTLRVDTEETYYNQNQVHERDSIMASYASPEMSMYAEDEIGLTSWLKANIGLRYVLFGTEDGMRQSLEPRAAVRIQLSPDAVFKASYSEMSQFIHNLQATYLDIPMSSWMPSTDRIAPVRAKQVAAGIYMDLPHNLDLNIEAYWKKLDNLHEYCGTETLYPEIASWEDELTQGMGRSYGAEAELTWRTAKTDLSAYYTLSWSERFFSRIWHDWYPARNDNRHKFTINASHRFSGRFDMYMSWNYHTGDRITVPTQFVNGQYHYSSPYNMVLPAYHRLDVGFNFRKTTRRGNERIWNLSLYNAYCRMNPMFAMMEEDPLNGFHKTRIVILSVIPIIPSFNYTLRF